MGGLGDSALDSGSSGRRQRPISMSIAALPDSLKDQIRSQAYGKKLSVPSIPASGMKSSTSASSIPSAAAQQPPLSPSSSSEKLANITIVLGEPKGKEATIIISPSATVRSRQGPGVTNSIQGHYLRFSLHFSRFIESNLT